MKRTITPVERLRGVFKARGDSHISHRALILGAIARGKQVIDGLSDAEDVQLTAACLRTLGCFVETMPDGRTIVLSKVFKSEAYLHAGNSIATVYLMTGLASGLPLACTISGETSLEIPYLTNVVEPLAAMGARITVSNGGVLPVTIEGGGLKGISYRNAAGSAEVKSAVLIAGLLSEGKTTIFEEVPTHDHTEILLRAMGVEAESKEGDVTVAGGSKITGIHVHVSGDFSSAAGVIAAASCLPGSEVYLPVTGVNPSRTGFIEVLKEMGADLVLENHHEMSGEPTADINVRYAGLKGVTVDDPVRVASMIEEIPLLAVVATQAEGETVVRSARALRDKESDRIKTIVKNLSSMGADIKALEDGFSVRGPTHLKGTEVPSLGDHRIAVAAAVAGLFAEGQTTLDDDSALKAFDPRFFDNLTTISSS